MPATTSSPCALVRNSPYSSLAPVEGLREKQTPVAEVSPRLPNTICCTLTAVPRLREMPCDRRYTSARGLSHDLNTALTARCSCSVGSEVHAPPSASLASALNVAVSSLRSSAVRSVS